jgi:hypothetical protein
VRKIYVMKVISGDIFKELMFVKMYENGGYNTRTKQRCSIFIQNAVVSIFIITTYTGSMCNVTERI